MDIIIYIGISQSLFAAILMLSKKLLGQSDQVLIAMLFFLAIEFSTSAFDLLYFESALLSSVFLLINPAFYLYIKSLISTKFKLKYIHLLHLLPYLVFKVITYFIQEPFTLNFLTPSTPFFWFSIAFSLANIISWLYYDLTSIYLVYKYRVNLENEFSTIEGNKKIAWLLFVLIFYVLYCSTALIIGLLVIKFEFISELPSIFTYSIMLMLAYIFGFYGLHQKPIYPVQSIAKAEALPKYQNSILSKQDIQFIQDEILNHFEKQRPYLNPEFNMTLLSSSLRIPKHHLTQVLSMGIGQNFFRFVNTYRINAVKTMLKDKANTYSIEAIGYECGFNSKSSFFTVFKALTGKTPLQFRNQ